MKHAKYRRKVVFPCGVKINNSLYSNERLKNYLGDTVQVIRRKNSLRVYDEKGKVICTAEKSLDLPKQERRRRV